MPDPLDDDLASLWAGAPVPPVSAVRARGEQRRARTRAGLAAGTATLAVLGVLAGAALTGGSDGRPDSLQPPFASTAPEAPEPEPTAPAAPQPEPEEPVEPAEPAPPPILGVLAAQLLDAPTLDAALGRGWQASGDLDEVFPSLLPCPEGPSPAEAGLLRGLDGPGDLSLVSQVLYYGSPGAAEAAWQALVDDVVRCPRTTPDSEDGQATAEHALDSSLPSSPGRVYGTFTQRDCADCPQFVQHFSLSVVGRHVALVRLSEGRLDQLPALADAAEDRARCGGSCP